MGPGGHIKPPLWSLTNIKRVAADITRVRPTFCAVRPTICAVGRHFARCGRHLPGQDSFFPFFENFSKCFGLFQGEKYTFFQKFSKIGLVAEKLMITFRGGGSDPKVIKITFFYYFFLTLPLAK